MTEKRFEIYCDDNIIDNITKKTYHAYDDYTANELVELLNEFQKENEQLKQLLDYADDLIQSYMSVHNRDKWENVKKKIKGGIWND